jgi:MFS family permease
MDGMALLRAAAVSRAPTAGLAAVGVFWGGFAAYVPDLKASVGADDSVWGIVMIMSAVGGMMAMYLGPRVLVLLGRLTLPVAGAALAVAALLPALAPGVALLGVCLFLMGAAVSTLDISSNVRISDLESRHDMHLMNYCHAMFSFPFGLSALAVSLMRQEGWTLAAITPVLAAVILLLVLAMFERDVAPPHVAAADAPVPDSPWRAILPAAAILFAAFVCENATEVWSALHIERTLGAPAGEGGLGPMMLGLTMGIGRLSGQFVASRIGEVRLVFWSALLGVAGALVLAGAPSKAIALTGVALLGFGVAVVVPSANSILGRAVAPEQRGYAISRAWTLGFTGFFLGPSIIGFVSDLTSLRLAFVFVALVMATIIPAVLRLGRA